MRKPCLFAILFGMFSAFPGLLEFPAAAQEKKKEEKPKEPPSILQAIPPFVAPGKPAKVLLRGKGLDLANSVAANGKEIKILRKGKAGVPQMLSANKVGDTEVEIEVPSFTGDKLALVVTGETGVSKSWDIPILAGVAEEKEPNPGFRQAQEFKVPGTMHGKIQAAQDVDVFQITLPPGTRVNIQVQAARFGSALDPVLTLYDETGKRLLFQDDTKESRDAEATLAMPKNGRVFLAIQDAQDQGGDLFYYLLRVEIRQDKEAAK